MKKKKKLLTFDIYFFTITYTDLIVNITFSILDGAGRAAYAGASFFALSTSS